MVIHRTAILEKGNDKVHIDLCSGDPYKDDEWCVCVSDNERQPPAPMSQAEAHAEFLGLCVKYVALWTQAADIRVRL